MDKAIRLLKTLGFAGLGITAVIIAGMIAFRDKGGVEVTSRTVLDRVSNAYFVVTRTVIVDQESQIEVDRGSSWSNLLWGQTITTEAPVRVDVGVDLTGLTEEDIKVNRVARTITIDLPEASVLDASLAGPIEVSNRQGILKRLLDNDPTADHNLASSLLVTEARSAVANDEELSREAREDAIRLLSIIVEGMDYALETE